LIPRTLLLPTNIYKSFVQGGLRVALVTLMNLESYQPTETPNTLYLLLGIAVA
ncbi:hypothetical protein HMPREF1544_10574, partial [Mucor circinelloides 1006PhL]